MVADFGLIVNQFSDEKIIYHSNKISVYFEYEPYSHEVLLYISFPEGDERFYVAEFAHVLAPELTRYQTAVQIGGAEAGRSVLRKLALDFFDMLYDLSVKKKYVYQDLKNIVDPARQNILDADIRSDASDAWERKDYAAVHSLYSRIEKRNLTAAEVAKLKYAKKHV